MIRCKTILSENLVGALSSTIDRHGFAASTRLMKEFPDQFHPCRIGFNSKF